MSAMPLQPSAEVERVLNQEALACNRCGRRWTFVVGVTDGREFCGYCGVAKVPLPSTPDSVEARP